MKRMILVVLALLLTLSVLACKSNEKPADAAQETVQPAAQEPVRVAALAGPTGVGLAYMMQDMQDKYSVEIFTAPDQVTAKIINGEVDIAAVPINLAAVLNSKTNGKVNVIAINTLGVLYILENGNEVNSVADLAGKTIYATGQGSTPEYVLNYLLAANGLMDSVTVEYMDTEALKAKLADGSITLALLPEPHVSIAMAQNSNVRVALKVNDLWSEKNDSQLVQGVYIVRKDYLDAHKDLVDAFLKDAKMSADKVVSEEGAAAVVVAQGIIGKEPIAKRAIPNCNITLLTGAAMKASVSAMLRVLFDANPKSIGGAMPNDEFYYTANPS